jgi:hypothetical protein
VAAGLGLDQKSIGGAAGAGSDFLGFSATRASVVISSAAMGG